ncbi:MAG TPA: BON domain-containing protein [Candidatus Paceibacterota bacterium]|nr:BON domain-containing protein [Candidatus Paceibacterota bacterium]
MKLLILIVGIVIGIVVAAWYFRSNPDDARQLQKTGERIENSAKSAGNSIQNKLSSLHLGGDDIKEELAKTGRVIRENAHKAGNAISDATADARITTAIKAAFVRDPDLSAWNISVNTTAGVVTLSGSVSNFDQIGKAMLVATETEGARQVISTLQVKVPAETKP